MLAFLWQSQEPVLGEMTVPYLIGYTEAPARIAIEAIHCTPSVVGTGGTVAGQSPAAFTRVNRGSTITITMGGPVLSIATGQRRGLLPYGSPDR